MCRLYTCRSSVPQRVECELLCAQNSLLDQSRQDAAGASNPHGWGLGTYTGVTPCVERQPRAAYDSAQFRSEAASVYTRNVVAHVRRATVGSVKLENTHPFSHDQWLFAHNGTIAPFDAVRSHLRDRLDLEHRSAIRGETDSEHLFYWFLFLQAMEPTRPLLDLVRQGVRQVIDWSDRHAGGTEVAANMVLTNGEETIGLCFGRSLWYVERTAPHTCEVCECNVHVAEMAGETPYRSVSVASEPVTLSETWTRIPDGTLFSITSSTTIRFQAL